MNKPTFPNPQSTPPSLPTLPDEILLHILTYLDIPDLLTLTRTSTHLRALAHDPLLHSSRLHCVPSTLSRIIPARRSLADLIAHRIYITRTTLAARRLGRDLIRIKLNRKLGVRPSIDTLVEKGVLPGECYGSGKVAPALVEVKRRVERERVKDVLRGWVGEWRKRGSERDSMEMEEKADVRRLVRRFAKAEMDNTSRRSGRREDPARAKVLGLRRFWEKVGSEGSGSS